MDGTTELGASTMVLITGLLYRGWRCGGGEVEGGGGEVKGKWRGGRGWWRVCGGVVEGGG